MSIENINDHIAIACRCGCVRFNLLASGSIECDGCQEKQNLVWSDKNGKENISTDMQR
jgi:uncharacterized Zn finger protein (UPF0148 family)